MWNLQVMQILQILGWLFILFCTGGLLLWVRMSYASAKASQERQLQEDPTAVFRRPLDESLRPHVHEAGHIIAHWLDPHTKDICGVAVFEDGTGFVGFRKHVPPPYALASYTWYRIVDSLAGIVAELHVYGSAHPKWSEDDLVNTSARIEAFLSTDPKGLQVTPWLSTGTEPSKSIGGLYMTPPATEVIKVLDTSYGYTRGLIAAHADHLRRLAFALKDGHGKLSSGQIEAIMGPRPRQHQPASTN